MDRQGYERGTNLAPNTGSGKPMGQKIKEHIPGTEEHRMREAGLVGSGTATGAVDRAGFGHDMGHSGYPHTSMADQSSYGHTSGLSHGHHGDAKPLGQTIKENIPGTEEYKLHAGAISTGAHLPDAHRTGYGHTSDMGYGQGHTGPTHGVAHTHTHATSHSNSSYDRSYEHDATHTGTGGMLGTGMGTTGMGTTGMTGTGVAGERKSMAEKIKEVIPGTREHEAKKVAEGRF